MSSVGVPGLSSKTVFSLSNCGFGESNDIDARELGADPDFDFDRDSVHTLHDGRKDVRHVRLLAEPGG